MATSRRLLVSRTYGKSSRNDCSSSKAFDEAMKIKSNTFNIKAASTISKWGKMTFTSTKISSADPKLDSRKRELIDESEDPFSFEPEFSPCKIKRSASPAPLFSKFNSIKHSDADNNSEKLAKEKYLCASSCVTILNKPERKFYKSKNNNTTHNDIKLKIKISRPLESSFNNDKVFEESNDFTFNHDNVHKYSIEDDFDKEDNDDDFDVVNNHILVPPSPERSKMEDDKIIDEDTNLKINDVIEDVGTTKHTTNDNFKDDHIANVNIDTNRDSSTELVKKIHETCNTLSQSTINGISTHIKDIPKKNSLTTRKFLCSKSTSQKKAKYKYRMWHEDETNDMNSSVTDEKLQSNEANKIKSTDAFDSLDDFGSTDDIYKPTQRRPIKNGNVVKDEDREKKINNKNDDEDEDDFLVFKKPSSSTYSKSNIQKQESTIQESDNQTQVVRDVKQAHECQESGETQEFEDDIEFIMDGLNCKQKLSIRCLSALSLLTKCTSSVFRMHLRAHGTLSQVFKILSDAPDCPALGLCVACLFLLMSRDRLFVDVERSSYELMLKLLDVDDSISTSNSTSTKYSSTTHNANIPTAINNNNNVTKKASFFKSKHSKKNDVNKDYENVQQKVFNICCGSQQQHLPQQQQFSDKAFLDLTLEQTVTSRIAMEALLRFSSRKDADVLKDDLRILGGFDRIIDATCLSIDEFDKDNYDDIEDFDGNEGDNNLDNNLDNSKIKLMAKIENFLQVLANVTNLNENNQTHLIMHKSATIITHLDRCLKRCVQYLKKANFVETNGKLEKECSGYVVYNIIISLLNVFINITHDNTCGSTKAGSSTQLVENLFTCLLTTNKSIPACCQFDLIVLCLGLLINLVEHCRSNLRILLHMHLSHDVSTETSTLRALGNFFTLHYESARQFEEEHDAELEKEQEEEQEKQRAINNAKSSNKLADCSGEWVESEMGVEWVSHHRHHGASGDDDDNINKNNMGLGNNHSRKSWSSQDSQHHRLNSLFSQDSDSINKALNKAGKHMEDSVVAAYVALLIGCIVQHDLDLAEQVRDTLPDYSFESLSRMLRKFYNFMSLTQGMRPSCDKSILQVLDVLDSC